MSSVLRPLATLYSHLRSICLWGLQRCWETGAAEDTHALPTSLLGDTHALR